MSLGKMAALTAAREHGKAQARAGLCPSLAAERFFEIMDSNYGFWYDLRRLTDDWELRDAFVQGVRDYWDRKGG